MESPSSEQLLADRVAAAPEDVGARLALVEVALARGQADYARRLLADVKDRPELRALHDRLRAKVETNARPLAPKPRGCALSALVVLLLVALLLVGIAVITGLIGKLPDVERRRELARERARLATLQGEARVRSAERVYALATEEDVHDEVVSALDPMKLEGGAAEHALELLVKRVNEPERIFPALAHPDREVRLEAARRLPAPRTDAEVALVVEAAEGDRELARLLRARIVACKDQRASDFVMRALLSDDRSVRLEMLRAVASYCSYHSDPRYDGVLDAALSSHDPEARSIAMEASLYHGIPEAGAALLETVRQKGLVGSREIEALARKLSRQGTDRLQQLLDEEQDPNAQTVLRRALQINARDRRSLTPGSRR